MSKKHNEDEKWKRQSHEGGEQGRECTKEASSEGVKTAEECSTENCSGNAGEQEVPGEEQTSSTQTLGEDSEEASSGKENSEKEENAELLQLKDKYLRTLAEYENFRKRSEKEKAQMFELGAKSIIEQLLPVVDNFERALEHIPEEEKENSFAKGVEGIYKQIQKMFSDCDIQAIEAVGQKFDPALHNAVMTEEEGDAEEDTVTADLQKGYTYRGNVVRHSMVKVKK
ncbi:nucleotide exchange factor GrpE [Oribacterium sp. oral taxon 108]|uniref:nucleotide exchange factor GrpE n=1 Tax=Oribacterium sp. oral taxon 108 TaxID=712414 RepID=UPI00020DD8C5|nr:nucleotide exchange factor GrpE [Oribacterium sp. oral taxon 108]EGL37147.1 co-chaperone GrpE [Oribacterium sp. oral taxon 108 str. F0425]